MQHRKLEIWSEVPRSGTRTTWHRRPCSQVFERCHRPNKEKLTKAPLRRAQSVCQVAQLNHVAMTLLLMQVTGCLGLCAEGKLHLCDSTGCLMVHTLLPATKLPLGQLVVVGEGARLVCEDVASIRKDKYSYTQCYLEAHTLTPVFPSKNGCPHMPLPHLCRRWVRLSRWLVCQTSICWKCFTFGRKTW